MNRPLLNMTPRDRDANFEQGNQLLNQGRFSESVPFFYQAYIVTRDISKIADDKYENDVLYTMQNYAWALSCAEEGRKSAEIYIEFLERTDKFDFEDEYADHWKIRACVAIVNELEKINIDGAIKYALKGIEYSKNFKKKSKSSGNRLTSFNQAIYLYKFSQKFDEAYIIFFQMLDLYNIIENKSENMIQNEFKETIQLIENIIEDIEKISLSDINYDEKIIILKSFFKNSKIVSERVYELYTHPIRRVVFGWLYLVLAKSYEETENLILGKKNREKGYEILCELENLVDQMDHSTRENFQEGLLIACRSIIDYIFEEEKINKFEDIENLEIERKNKLRDLYFCCLRNSDLKNTDVDKISDYFGFIYCVLDDSSQAENIRTAFSEIIAIFSLTGSKMENNDRINFRTEFNKLQARIKFIFELS